MAAKLCRSCNRRPVGAQPKYGDARQARVLDLCTPCLAKAEHENVHSDDGHDPKNPIEGCWVCHPELDASAEDYATRKGSSRSGVRHTVRGRASGAEKAATVAEVLAAAGHTVPKPVSKKGLVTLVLPKLCELTWDTAGRYTSGRFTTDRGTRAVRNVSELYRLLGVEAVTPRQFPEPVEVKQAPADPKRVKAAKRAAELAELAPDIVVPVQPEPAATEEPKPRARRATKKAVEVQEPKTATPAPKPAAKRARKPKACGCECNRDRMGSLPFGRVLRECTEAERCGHTGCGAAA